MSIWEDKKHNDPKYVGQVPVTPVPEDLSRHRRMSYSVDGRNQIPWPHSVRHVQDPFPNTFPGNPGPPTSRINPSGEVIIGQADRPLLKSGAEGPLKLTPGASRDPQAVGYVRERYESK
jgi:hypothetical protein